MPSQRAECIAQAIQDNDTETAKNLIQLELDDKKNEIECALKEKVIKTMVGQESTD